MKKILSGGLFILITQCLAAQFQRPEMNLDSLMPKVEFENISNQMIYSDSVVSTFIIWVKTSVPLHKHAWHTEQVTVLEGTADMRVGEKLFSIKKGDIIFIPEDTPHSVMVTSDIPLKVLSIQAPEFKGDDRILLEK